MEYRLFHGNAPFLSLEDVHNYIEQKKKESPTLEITILQGEDIQPATIIDTLSSQNLFAPSRLIFVKRIYKNKKKDTFLDGILALIKDNTSTDTIIFWEDQKIKSNTKYYKFFKKDNLVVDEDKLNKRTFYTWLKKELDKYGLTIDKASSKTLAENTNYDPERCHNAIQKFLLTGETQINNQTIQNIVADTLEEDIWGLIDSINAGDKVNSLQIIEKLKAQGSDANYILSMLARNLRLITLTKFLYENGTQYREIASIIKIPPFTVPSLIGTSKSYNAEKIKMLYTKLSNLDYQIKVGQIDGFLGLTLLCSIL